MGIITRSIANNIVTGGKLDGTDGLSGVISASNIADASITNVTAFSSSLGDAIESVATDPVSPSEGQLWYNTTIGVLKVYKSLGGVWAAGGNMGTARSAAGAVSSSTEAALQCPDTVIPGKIPPGETPTPDKPGFLTPDKLSLLTAGLIPPQAYVPSVAELPYRQGDLVLEYWLSKAQQRQQTYNTSANTLGQYQPGTALASNLSFLQGQTGEGVSQDIAQVDSRNVDRANQFMAQELQRKSMNDMYNTNARDKRYEGLVTTKQNLDNARRKYLSGITKATNNMWANRMYLDMVNKVNPIYNVDPRSGLSFFKQGYDPTKLGSASASAPGNMDWASISKGYTAAKSSFPDLTVEQYMNRTVPKVSYSDTDGDGYANSSRSNMPSMYMQGLVRMYGGQIGPWTKKKKK